MIGKKLKFGETMNPNELKELFHSGSSQILHQNQKNQSKNPTARFEEDAPPPAEYATFSRDNRDRKGGDLMKRDDSINVLVPKL
jgi:hypothetical protein